MPDSALVFGATGALGAACADELRRRGVAVTEISHHAVAADDGWVSAVTDRPATRVVWAQGRNAAGGIINGDLADVQALFDANVAFIVKTMRALLDADALGSPCRTVILSSVWQDLARQEKMAYVVSKAAVAGLVRSLAADLGSRGIAVNAVAPGVIDTPMARANLSSDQIADFETATPSGALCSPEDVARVVAWLTSAESRGVDAATIPVDGGWSEIRYV